MNVIAGKTAKQSFRYFPDNQSNQNSQHGSCDNIARIMYANIDPAVAGDERPGKQPPSDAAIALAKGRGQKGGHSEGVGGMGGDEAVTPPGKALGQMYQTLQIGIETGPQTMEQGLAHMGRQLVGTQDHNAHSQENPYTSLAILFNDEVSQQDVNGNPRPHPGDGHHHRVEPPGMLPVQP